MIFNVNNIAIKHNRLFLLKKDHEQAMIKHNQNEVNPETPADLLMFDHVRIKFRTCYCLILGTSRLFDFSSMYYFVTRRTEAVMFCARID